MKAYSSFSSTGSDHRIVSSKIILAFDPTEILFIEEYHITELHLNQTNHCKTNIQDKSTNDSMKQIENADINRR